MDEADEGTVAREACFVIDGLVESSGWLEGRVGSSRVERERNATEIVQTASTIVGRAITQAVARSGLGSGVCGDSSWRRSSGALFAAHTLAAAMFVN